VSESFALPDFPDRDSFERWWEAAQPRERDALVAVLADGWTDLKVQDFGNGEVFLWATPPGEAEPARVSPFTQDWNDAMHAAETLAARHAFSLTFEGEGPAPGPDSPRLWHADFPFTAWAKAPPGRGPEAVCKCCCAQVLSGRWGDARGAD
jgi:hypothetical protein